MTDYNKIDVMYGSKFEEEKSGDPLASVPSKEYVARIEEFKVWEAKQTVELHSKWVLKIALSEGKFIDAEAYRSLSMPKKLMNDLINLGFNEDTSLPSKYIKFAENYKGFLVKIFVDKYTPKSGKNVGKELSDVIILGRRAGKDEDAKMPGIDEPKQEIVNESIDLPESNFEFNK